MLPMATLEHTATLPSPMLLPAMRCRFLTSAPRAPSLLAKGGEPCSLHLLPLAHIPSLCIFDYFFWHMVSGVSWIQIRHSLHHETRIYPLHVDRSIARPRTIQPLVISGNCCPIYVAIAIFYCCLLSYWHAFCHLQASARYLWSPRIQLGHPQR